MSSAKQIQKMNLNQSQKTNKKKGGAQFNKKTPNVQDSFQPRAMRLKRDTRLFNQSGVEPTGMSILDNTQNGIDNLDLAVVRDVNPGQAEPTLFTRQQSMAGNYDLMRYNSVTFKFVPTVSALADAGKAGRIILAWDPVLTDKMPGRKNELESFQYCVPGMNYERLSLTIPASGWKRTGIETYNQCYDPELFSHGRFYVAVCDGLNNTDKIGEIFVDFNLDYKDEESFPSFSTVYYNYKTSVFALKNVDMVAADTRLIFVGDTGATHGEFQPTTLLLLHEPNTALSPPVADAQSVLLDAGNWIVQVHLEYAGGAGGAPSGTLTGALGIRITNSGGTNLVPECWHNISYPVGYNQTISLLTAAFPIAASDFTPASVAVFVDGTSVTIAAPATRILIRNAFISFIPV